MAKSVAKAIRASETVGPYAPGAIVDILGQSFAVPTAESWCSASRFEVIESERLVSALRVTELRAAPTTSDVDNVNAPGIRVSRFPSWLFCQVCRDMVQWQESAENGAEPRCPERGCGGRLVPMRFVAVCSKAGHMTDVPWKRWVHSPVQECENTQLRFEVADGASEGLRSLKIVCLAGCGRERGLDLLRKDVLIKEGITCRGEQPWDKRWSTCGAPLDPLQRGSTSVHFGETLSAIDIPKVQSRRSLSTQAIVNHGAFAALHSLPKGSPPYDSVLQQIATDLKLPVDAVQAALDEGSADVLLPVVRSSILADEFEAFVRAETAEAPFEDFRTRMVDWHDGASTRHKLSELISSVLIVDRLREVRVARGFRRHSPDAKLVPAVKLEPHEKRWLPAVQGYGEGIYFRFAPESIERWASRPAVQQFGYTVLSRQGDAEIGSNLHPASAEYVMLHTFAHLLMRQLSFSSGYAESSLKERIYAESAGDFGVFIYTTSSDVEGTLGGLARQGEPDLLLPLVIEAIEQAEWCPNDPVCIESGPQSIGGLNQAACHACCLSPETSCESMNLLLNRSLIVGAGELEGYFSKVLEV